MNTFLMVLMIGFLWIVMGLAVTYMLFGPRDEDLDE